MKTITANHHVAIAAVAAALVLSAALDRGVRLEVGHQSRYRVREKRCTAASSSSLFSPATAASPEASASATQCVT